MRKLSAVILYFFTLLVVFSFVSVASDITGANYSGQLRVTNNGTATENVSTVFELYTQGLIDQGNISDNVTNSSILTHLAADTAYMPAAGDNTTWVVFIPSISGNTTTLSYRFYTGGGDMSSQISYFPDSSGMTTADNTSLELGDNFTIEQSGWIDTSSGSDKNLLFKENAIRVYVSGTGNITAALFAEREEYAINDDGSDDIDSATKWLAQTFTTVGGYEILSVDLKMFRTANPGTVNVAIRATAAGKPTGADLATGTTDADTLTNGAPGEWRSITLASPITLAAATQYAIVVDVPAADGANKLNWRWDATAPAYAGGSRNFSVNSGVAWTIDVTRDFMFKTIAASQSITATGVSSGEHLWAASANVTSWGIYIDGALQDTTTMTDNVTDNSENWTFLQNGVMVYLEYQIVTINGTQQQYIGWQNDTTTFTDQSGNGHDAAPTFRTTSSDANVSATLVDFLPITIAEASGYDVGSAPAFVSSVPTQPAEMYAEGTITLPGAAVINRALDAGGIPRTFFWYPVLFLQVIAAGFFVYRLFPSLLIMAVVMGAAMVFFALNAAWGLWILYSCVFPWLLIMVLEKHFTW